ncbi:MAG TPA: prolyl oligopeptidase family serine peptidase [Gemmatimonadales bacterium]|nr:prolyl oligopeptidase family serine peptidase [Gemmatimonadales bacterium]
MRASAFGVRRSATLAVASLVAFTFALSAQAPQPKKAPAAKQTGPAAAAAAPALAPAAQPAGDPLEVEGYIKPPEAIAHLVTAPREANFTYTAASAGARKYFIRTISDGMPSIDQLGRPHYNLGGFQVDYQGNRARAMNTSSRMGIELYEWATGKTTRIDIPAGARTGAATFSPDGSMLAFVAEFPTSTQIYLADPATGKSRPLTTTSLLATSVQNFAWTADSKSIVTVLVPDARGAEPREPAIATEPLVRLNEDKKLHTEFFPSVLESLHDKALLEYYTTGQLALIDVKTRLARKIGAPGMIQRLDANPDGKFFRVTYLDKPFSYVLPVSNFGNTEVLIDETGKVLHQMSHRPLRESQDSARTDTTRADTAAGRGGRGAAAGGRGAAPGGRGASGITAADTARRSLAWHPIDDAMIYLQMEPFAPGQKPDTTVKRQDRVMEWLPPFDTTATSSKVLYASDNCINSVQFSDNGRIMFLSEAANGGTREVAVYLDQNNKAYEVIAARAGNAPRAGGAAGAPATATRCGGGAAGGRGGAGGGGAGRGGAAAAGAGTGLITKVGSRGVPVVQISTDGKYVYTETAEAGARGGRGGRGGGRGAAPAGAADSTQAAPPAFVDRIEIATGTRDRIYQTTSTIAETIATPLDDDFNHILVNRESATVVPQSFVVDTKAKDAKQITSNKDPLPEMAGLIKKTITAVRADGHHFKVNITLPADWKPGTRLPALFWFYPSEYETQQAYDGQGRGNGTADAVVNPNRFPTYGPRTMAFITFEGYALIEPDTPIFAQNGQLPNDHYVDDLRDDLYATIEALDTMGYVDRNRLAIGGHSYGAFSTANAMVHTPYFKAGIAGDGDYNRTLTPTGFQNERRDLWQGRDTYLEMSPFLYADHLSGALLMYHSEEDQNVGTAPMNSIRMFHALQSLGKTTALYMYPYEDHGPVTKETDLDQWARWVAWLDKYVKNAGKDARPADATVVAKPDGN